MMGKIFGAVVIIALLIYAFTVMNKTTENIEAEVKQVITIQEQLESEGLPPQPAQPPSSVTTTTAPAAQSTEQQPTEDVQPEVSEPAQQQP